MAPMDVLELREIGKWYEVPQTVIYRTLVPVGDGIRLAPSICIMGALQWFRNGKPDGEAFVGEDFF